MSEADSFDGFLPEGMEGPGEGVSELESDCEVVSGLASGLYAELERLILAHGEGAAAGLVPLAVATLESLQGASAESRAQRAEAEQEREENRRLLAQYERERAERKRIQEKCLELEDLMENDRKTQKARLELAAAENRQMEVKARNCADMMFQLEEEKGTLEREHNKLLQTYHLVLRNLKDLQTLHKTQPEEGRYSGNSTPLPKKFREQRQSTGDCSDTQSSLSQEEGQGQADLDLQADTGGTAGVSGNPAAEMERPLPLVDPVTQGASEEVPVTPTGQ
ncbi:JNK-interacting protein-like [Mustelus asterias]